MSRKPFFAQIAALPILFAAATVQPRVACAQQADEGTKLEEIVVTAQKREERLQDVPIAITALTQDTLSGTRTMTAQDIQFSVPAMTYFYDNGFGQPYMRGVGSELTEPNADASVATYIDGAYVAYSQATIVNLLGVERVEVLEGPQGTLYGRNAVGGAIDIVTLSPGDKLEGAASVTQGNYADKELTAHVSGPVTDNLKVGIYAAGTWANPYVDYVSPDGIYPPGQPRHDRNTGLRLKAIWDPTGWLKLTGSVEQTVTHSFMGNTLRQIDPTLFPAGKVQIQPYNVYADSADFIDINQRVATLKEQIDLKWAQIVGISNYRRGQTFSTDDADATQAFILNAYIKVPSRQYSQELQLVSAPSSAVKWIAGVFYFSDSSSFNPDGIVSPLIFQPSPIFSSAAYGGVDTVSKAAFGQITVPFDPWIENLRLTLGGRYTVDEKDLTIYSKYFDVSDTQLGPTQTFPDNGESKKWSKFTPKATLDYRLGGTLLYVTYSEGFKSGVFNVLSPSTPGPVNPEVLKAVQVGSKSDLLNNRLRINAEAYHYDWSDLQVEVIDFTAGSLGGLQNAASAKMYGADISAEAVVTDNLHLRLAISGEHSEYTSFPSASGFTEVPGTTGLTAISVDATGNQTSRTPKWVLNGGADYTHPVPGGGQLGGHVNVYYNSGYFWTAQNTFRELPYALLGLSADYATPDEHWKFTAWGTNLTNRYYSGEFTANGAFGILVQDAPPRMFGLTAAYKF